MVQAQSSTPIVLNGTIKRAANGALVAEVWSGERVQPGQDVTVDGLTATVIDRGRGFKRNGYGFCYLYLREDTSVAPDAAAQPAPTWLIEGEDAPTAAGLTFRNHERLGGDDGPEYLTSVTVTRRWIPEDGDSFGLSTWSGYFYTATVRPATEDEAAPVRQAEAERAQERAERRLAAAEAQARREAAQAAQAAHTAWRASALAGLVECSQVPAYGTAARDRLTIDWDEPAYVAPEMGDRYAPILWDGAQVGLIHRWDHDAIVHVTPETADAWYRLAWEAQDKAPALIARVLDRVIRAATPDPHYGPLQGDDYYRWISREIGRDELVRLGRREPFRLPVLNGADTALASRLRAAGLEVRELVRTAERDRGADVYVDPIDGSRWRHSFASGLAPFEQERSGV